MDMGNESLLAATVSHDQDGLKNLQKSSPLEPLDR